MMKVEIVLLAFLVTLSGCISGGLLDNKSPDNIAVAKSVPEALASLGYASYGFDDGSDNILGSRMIVGMVQAEGKENVSKQIEQAFNVLLGFNKTRKHYVVELDDDGNSALFIAKGEDLIAYYGARINKQELSNRNQETMRLFFEKINDTLDEETFKPIIL